MKLVQLAMEENACNGCSNGGFNSKGLATVSKRNTTHATDATYDKGEGIKDTVLISGPLSHAYTQALLMTLKKEPLANKQEEPVEAEEEKEEVEKDPLLKQNEVGQIGISQESVQQEMAEHTFLAKQFEQNSEEVKFLANKFDFMEGKDLPTNVVCSTTVISITDFMRPHNLFSFTQDRTGSFIEHVVVVVADPMARTSKGLTKTKFFEVAERERTFADRDDQEEFDVAVESYVKPAGYKLFIGMEAYFAYLKGLSKELGI